MGRIVNKLQSVPCGNISYLLHITDVPVNMHRQDRRRMFTYKRFKAVRVEGAVRRPYVAENRTQAASDYGVSG